MSRSSLSTLLLLLAPPILFLSFEVSLCAVDPRFQACRNRTTCGNLNISFPFFIQGQQKEFCGFPGFNISCTDNQPILDLSNAPYIIRGIDYPSQSLRVSNPNWNDSCEFPGLIHNLTLPENRFVLKPYVRTLFLFYHCNTSSSAWGAEPDGLSRHRVGCSDPAAGNDTVLGLYGDDHERGNASRSCKSVVMAPVEVKDGETAETLIRRGFRMRWTASDCSTCQVSGGRCGFNYSVYHFKCFCPDRPHAWRCNVPGKSDAPLKIGLGAGIGALSIVVIILSIFMIRYRRMHRSLNIISRKNNSADNSSMSELAMSHVYFEVPIFQYKELEEATNNFASSQELGDGGFGTVYYGKLRDGREVAVKRLYEHNYRRVKQFMTEVQILTRLHHKNLVSLYGCTSRQSRELLLVYEYVPNGTVADHLHGDRAKDGPIPWHIRMNIAIETATALAYLHASDIIHRDVKTTNILLDSNFCVKVGDFGLSRLFPNDVTHVSTAPQGTPGYVDPEYHRFYQLTEKSDVYSFGVVLVELVSSLPAVDIGRDMHEINLANLAIDRIKKGLLHNLVDPSLGFGSDAVTREKIRGVIELAFMCLQQEREMRPSMLTVLEQLKAIARGTKAVAGSKRFSPSTESDEAALLKTASFPSPISVTQKWVSSGSSCTRTTSA